MFEWIDNISTWFTELGEEIDYIFNAIEQLIYDLDNYIRLSTSFIYFSSGMSIILAIMILAQARKIGKIQVQTERILELLYEDGYYGEQKKESTTSYE